MNKTYQKNFLTVMCYSSVKSFQKKNGLTADGIWGKNTDAKATAIARGVQKKLIANGAKIDSDGLIGAKTVSAIKAYQKKKKLSQTGKIDSATAKVLMVKQPEKLSEHFTRSEFKCECGGKWCDGYNYTDVDMRLVNVLEKIRTYYGKPITITSGIRCQRYNDSLPGSIPNSVHRLGGAADIYIPGITTTQPKKVISLAYKYGAAYAYTNGANMSGAVHINV